MKFPSSGLAWFTLPRAIQCVASKRVNQTSLWVSPLAGKVADGAVTEKSSKVKDWREEEAGMGRPGVRWGVEVAATGMWELGRFFFLSRWQEFQTCVLLMGAIQARETGLLAGETVGLSQE